MSELKKIIVKSGAPVRLDRYIRRYFPSTTQGIIEKALRKGQIKLNGLKSKANVRVADSDEITFASSIIVKDSRDSSKSFSKATVILAKKLLSEYLIYSSPEFIAIDKPSGLAVQGRK